MFKNLATILFCLSSIQAQAHEGHDHGAKLSQAPKGGIMRELETVNLELLSKGMTIKIYIYDKNMKPEDVAKFPVSATVTLPRKTAESVPLVAKGDHWETEYNPKKAHRFTFILSIKQGGHDDNVKFTVEPKK